MSVLRRDLFRVVDDDDFHLSIFLVEPKPQLRLECGEYRGLSLCFRRAS